MLTITRIAFRANRRRLLGTCSAALIGVAFLAATLVLGDTMRGGFDQAFRDANAGTDVLVRSAHSIDVGESTAPPPLARSVVDRVTAVDGVGAWAVSIEGTAQLVGSDGEVIGGEGPPTIGTNWVEPAELNPYSLAEGRAPRADGEVVIDRGSAETGGLAVGDHTTVRTPAPTPVEVVGIATFAGEDNLGGTTLVAFTEPRARELFAGGANVVTGVVLGAREGVTPEQLLGRVDPVLPDGAEAITGEALTTELVEDLGEDFLDFFTIFLTVFSGIALLVATFSIHNTFTVVLAQRTNESALLRAIGATRRQVLGGVALEAVVIGLGAGVLGALTGVGLAAGMLELFAAGGFGLPGDGLVVELDSLGVAAGVGLVVTLVAALAPSIRASRVAPIAAMRDVARDPSATSPARRTLGGVLTVGGLAAVALGRSSMQVISIGVVAMVIGVVALGPVIAGPVVSALGALPSRLRGASGTLARGNATRSPRRTAGTATALLVGVCVVSLFTVFAASLKTTMHEAFAGSVTGDLVVQADGFSGAGLGPELALDLEGLPALDAAVGIAYAGALIGGEEEYVAVSELAALPEVIDLEIAEGSLVAGPDGLAVSADLAEQRGWAVGDDVEVTMVDGTTASAPLVATYERPEIIGSVIVSRDLAAPHTPQLMDRMVLMSAGSDVELGAEREAAEGVAERHGVTEVLDVEGFTRELAGEIDGFLTLVYALLALSIVIALIGIGNTLSLSVHERTRELGLLRAVGQTRRQLRSMVRWESVMIATFGTAVGAALGTFIAWAFVGALTEQEGIGTFDAPLGQLAVVLVVGAIVGVVAAARPARRAAKLDVLAAISAE